MNIHLQNEKGFTLVEAMVALLITGVLMVAVMNFVYAQMKGYNRENMAADTQQNLRVAMDEIIKDVRVAGSAMPSVPIYTGFVLNGAGSPIASGAIYPVYVVQGIDYTVQATTNDYRQIFKIASTATAANVNDSLILIYRDPERDTLTGNAYLMQAMSTKTSAIVVPASSVNMTGETGFKRNIPFVITNPAGTKADLFMISGDPSASGTVSYSLPVVATAGDATDMYNNTANTGYGHDINFNAATAADGVAGYPAGSRIYAVRVVRYDWSPDVAGANYPITRIVNNDATRATNDAVGEYFGNVISTTNAAHNTNMAIDIQYTRYSDNASGGATTFQQGMPSNPMDIGALKITLTARTAIPASTYSNNTMLRTRTLTTIVQPRDYSGW